LVPLFSESRNGTIGRPRFDNVGSNGADIEELEGEAYPSRLVEVFGFVVDEEVQVDDPVVLDTGEVAG